MEKQKKHQTIKLNITEVCENIFRIKTPLKGSPLGSINSYLIKGSDSNLLIDTGYRMDMCIDSIKNSLTKLEINPEDTDILLTHFHDDHSGASTSLIHPSRKIYVPVQEHDFFGINVGPHVYRESRKAKYLKEGISEEYFSQIMEITKPGAKGPDLFSDKFEFIEDKQVIKVGKYKLTAIHTPGHTPGHMCFWEPNHKIMFTGDHVLFDISSNIIPWPGIPNTLGTYLYSLKKLRGYDVETTLPGHREPGNLMVRIDEQLEHHKQRLNECESIVKLYPGLTALDITKLLSWRVHKQNGAKGIPLPLMRYAFGECLCHLDHLCFLSKIKRMEKEPYYVYR